MKYSTRLSMLFIFWLLSLCTQNCDLTSNKLAESIQTNPAYVRQLMSALRNGGLLVSVKGHPRPALAREPEKITLLDAYRAVEGNQAPAPSGHPHHPACGVGVNIHWCCGIFTWTFKSSGTKNARNHVERCAGTISHDSHWLPLSFCQTYAGAGAERDR